MPSENMKKLRELTEVLTSTPFSTNVETTLGKYIDDNDVVGSELFSHDDVSVHALSISEGIFVIENSNMVLIVVEGALSVETKSFHKKVHKGSSVRIDSDDKYYVSSIEDSKIITIKIGVC